MKPMVIAIKITMPTGKEYKIAREIEGINNFSIADIGQWVSYKTFEMARQICQK